MARGKSKTIRYEMRYMLGEGFYRLHDDLDVYVCAYDLRQLFEVGRNKGCDLVVSTARPRGNNFQILRRLKESNVWKIIGPAGESHYPMGCANARLNTDFPDSRRLYLSFYA